MYPSRSFRLGYIRLRLGYIRVAYIRVTCIRRCDSDIYPSLIYPTMQLGYIRVAYISDSDPGRGRAGAARRWSGRSGWRSWRRGTGSGRAGTRWRRCCSASPRPGPPPEETTHDGTAQHTSSARPGYDLCVYIEIMQYILSSQYETTHDSTAQHTPPVPASAGPGYGSSMYTVSTMRCNAMQRNIICARCASPRPPPDDTI